jgi:hypothetical protein
LSEKIPAAIPSSTAHVEVPADVEGDSDQYVGVRGKSNAAAGVVGQSTSGSGVEGSGGSNGVHGISTSSMGSGVLGENYGHGPGVSGTSRGGVGVYGKGSTLAGQFDGTVAIVGDINAGASLNVTGDVNAKGNVNVTGDVILSGSDCAEDFYVSPGIEPGSVVVIDGDCTLRACERAYDNRVAGVIAGAGDYRPGIIMGRNQDGVVAASSTGQERTRRPLALSGRTYCRVDAAYSPVNVGDMLTTSPTRGCAMRASDQSLAFGAVIGKSLGRLEAGVGLVPILVSLQ